MPSGWSGVGGGGWVRRLLGLLRCGKPVFLAVNKMDTDALLAGAENFRRLGFRNVLPISAEHGSGIGDLLDAVFEVLPESAEAAEIAVGGLDGLEQAEIEPQSDDASETAARPVRRLRSHGEYESKETKIA